MNIGAIRSAFVDVLSQLDGLNVYEFIPDNPVVPAVVVSPDTISFDSDFDDSASGTFVLTILTPSVNTENGQSILDDFLATTGQTIRAKIADNNTLNGTVDSVRVTSMRNYGTRTLADQGTKYHTAQFVCEVFS